jgi:hypothetical protein
MTDDKIEIKYKEKAKVTLEDDYIIAETEKCTADMTKDVITIKNDKSTLKLNADKFSEKNTTQSLYKILKDFMKLFNSHNMFGPPPKHKLFPPDVLKIQKIITQLDALME